MSAEGVLDRSLDIPRHTEAVVYFLHSNCQVLLLTSLSCRREQYYTIIDHQWRPFKCMQS